jgi:hypothetical protein
MSNIFGRFMHEDCGINTYYKPHSFRGALATYFMMRAPKDWVQTRCGWAASSKTPTLDLHYNRCHQNLNWEMLFLEPEADPQRYLWEEASTFPTFDEAFPSWSRGSAEGESRKGKEKVGKVAISDWESPPSSGGTTAYMSWLDKLVAQDLEFKYSIPLFVETGRICILCHCRISSETAVRTLAGDLRHLKCQKLSHVHHSKRDRSYSPTASFAKRYKIGVPQLSSDDES